MTKSTVKPIGSRTATEESSPPMSTSNDLFQTHATLLARLRDPVPAEREIAWAEFHQRYLPVIGGFANRCGANRQDVEDIVQDVLTALVGHIDQFTYDRQRGRFRGYLKTITIRAALRRAGKNLRFQGLPLANVPDLELAVEPLWNDLWEQELISQGLRLVRAEISDSLAFRAFEQYVLLDRPAEEVAADLNTSVNNVHQAKTRVTRLLREAVQRLRQQEP